MIKFFYQVDNNVWVNALLTVWKEGNETKHKIFIPSYKNNPEICKECFIITKISEITGLSESEIQVELAQ